MSLRDRFFQIRPLVSLGVLLFAGCGDYVGDRAETGECPLGEVCSPDTPEGLYFVSPKLGEQGISLHFHDLLPTAVGGTQTITVFDAATHRPMEFPFAAVLTDNSLIFDPEQMRLWWEEGKAFARKQVENSMPSTF